MPDPRAVPTDADLVLEVGALRLELLRRGASVRRLFVPAGDGSRPNVVLGYAASAGYGSEEHYFGTTVGRLANRLAHGRFALGGASHQVPANHGRHALHGGPEGFDRRDWEVVEHTGSSAGLRLVSPDGDQGFPGTLHVEVAFSLTPDEVRIDYTATTDAPTVVNLTNHSYFNLDGEGGGSIDDHLLVVHADAYTPTDAELIPTGELARVEGTPFDWREPTAIGPRVRQPHPQLGPAKGLDHNFALSGKGLRRAATLESVRSGIRLEVHTDQPGLQVYTGNFLDGTTTGTSGRSYRQGDGIALETQGFPDSPNQPAFPSAVLLPGEVYRTTTRWRFSTSR